MDDDRGTSAVFLHTDRGKELWASVCEELKAVSVPLSEAVRANPAYYRSPSHKAAERLFHREIGKTPLSRLIQKCLKKQRPSLCRRMAGRLKRELASIKRRLKRKLRRDC